MSAILFLFSSATSDDTNDCVKKINILFVVYKCLSDLSPECAHVKVVWPCEHRESALHSYGIINNCGISWQTNGLDPKSN